MFGPGEEFLGAQSIFFFFFLTDRSSKELKSPEAHPWISFFTSYFSWWQAQSYWSRFFLRLFLLHVLIRGEVKIFIYLQSQLFSWWLGSSAKKFDCDNSSSDWKTVKRQKEIVERFDFRCVDAMALNDEIRVSVKRKWCNFIFLMICLSPEMYFAELYFFQELFCRPKKFFWWCFYLFFRGWWQIVLSLNACGKLLEVIFFRCRQKLSTSWISSTTWFWLA